MGFSFAPSLGLAVMISSLALGCDAERQASADTKPGEAQTPVRLFKVRRDNAARPLKCVGMVEGKRDTALSFKVGGVVTLVSVDQGALVKKGQVLARVDPTEVQGSLAQARESLAKAERDEKRAQSFHDSGVFPLAELENAKTALEIAKAAASMASFNAAHSVITAPDDGVIEKRSIEPGEVVGPGAPGFTLRGSSPGWVVRVGLSDRDALDLAVGQRAKVSVDALDGAPIDGTVTQIAERASSGTGTYEVEITIAPKTVRLLAGLVAKVVIERVERRERAFIPTRALVEGNGKSGAVFVVQNGHAKRTPIDVAFLSGEELAVDQGLDGVSEVVTEGAPYLREGSPVSVAVEP